MYRKLENIVKEKHISNSLYVRHAYSRNVDLVLQGVPDIVIRPKDAQEISEILKIANEENIPVIPRGGGDCEFGGSKPIGDGGIVLETKRMNEAIDTGAQTLTTSCPFCLGNLSNAYKEMGPEVQEKITVIDIIDLIASKI